MLFQFTSVSPLFPFPSVIHVVTSSALTLDRAKELNPSRLVSACSQGPSRSPELLLLHRPPDTKGLLYKYVLNMLLSVQSIQAYLPVIILLTKYIRWKMYTIQLLQIKALLTLWLVKQRIIHLAPDSKMFCEFLLF